MQPFLASCIYTSIRREKTMKHEDLTKKLENLRTPQIELRGHKQALKMALLNSGHFRERTIMDWAKILAPIAAVVVLIAIVGLFVMDRTVPLPLVAPESMPPPEVLTPDILTVTALPDILIKQEPADPHIFNTIGETRTFNVTTKEAATITWEMHLIREGPRPRIPLPEQGEALPRLHPEPVAPPPFCDEPLPTRPTWEIREDVKVTFSEVKISPPKVGHFRVSVFAEMVVDGELRKWGLATWHWYVEEAP
jgi:hypothetical protein